MFEGNPLVSTFHHWAELGRMSRALNPGLEARWKSVKRIISAAEVMRYAQSTRLRSLLQQSSSRLSPLGDPLLSDFDLHRWLVGEREEIYSDWLEWVVKQLPTPKDILEVFGIEESKEVTEKLLTFSTAREVVVRLPHWKSFKKLDLVIRCDGCVLLVIEVKKTSPEGADVAKQDEYAAWAESQPEANKYLLLLAREGERPEYHRFRLWTYWDLCLHLREKVCRLIEQRHITIATGALVIAYLGALEQNLLGLSSAAAQRAFRGETTPMARDLTEYLEHFVGRESGQ